MAIPEHHTHAHGICPVTGANSHDYCPPQKGDSRSPCPALNTLANHNYIPRDGKCITPHVLMHGLREGYHLSASLAWVLVHGGFYLLGQRRKRICLHDLSRHNCIEHNASLVHPDTEHRDEYAPVHMHEEMLEDLMQFSKDGYLMTPDDVARARVCREAEYLEPMDRLHAEIARGEMAIVLNLFNNPAPYPSSSDSSASSSSSTSVLSKMRSFFSSKKAATQGELAPLPGVPIDILRVWMHKERLPDNWKPYHKTTLIHVVKMSSRLRSTMKVLAKQQAAADKKKEAENAVVVKAAPVALAIVAPERPQTLSNIVAEQGDVGDAPLTTSPLRGSSPASSLDATPTTAMTRESTMSSVADSDDLHTPIDIVVPTIIELPVLETESPDVTDENDEKVFPIRGEVTSKRYPVQENIYTVDRMNSFEGAMEMPSVAVAAN